MKRYKCYRGSTEVFFFTKRIIGMNNLDYKDRLSKLRLPSIEFRRLRGDMIDVFKITNGMYDVRTTKTFF